MDYSKNPYAKKILLPDSLEAVLVDFNQQQQVFVKVPYNALLKHKDALITHALGKEADLSGWHEIVKNPHAVAHVIKDGKVVLSVPPLLTRVPNENPSHYSQTLTAAAQRHELEFDRLPIAAARKLKHALESYPLPKVKDDQVRQMWMDFLAAFKVVPAQKITDADTTVQVNDEDDFIFD